jgi:hypothetical protein
MSSAINTLLQNAGAGSNKTVPITNVIFSDVATHAYVTADSAKIGNLVATTLGSLIQGQADASFNNVAQLAASLIAGFLGDTEQVSDSKYVYYVAREGLSIVRIDLGCWYQQIEIQALQAKISLVSAFAYYKSTVDLSRLDFNLFLNLYNAQLSASATPADVQAAIQNARQIYAALTQNNPPTPNPPTHVQLAPGQVADAPP